MKRRISFFAVMALVLFGTTNQAQALTVSSQDCSVIDTTDGNTLDWESIPYLVNEDTTPITGTVYYYDADTEDWVTDEPENYSYSVNTDKWADIRTMKTCNTADDFFMMMEGSWPMFALYDHENDIYRETGYSQGEMDETSMPNTIPEDWNYWMVWKMQKADATGNIIYFAADIGVDKNFSEFQDQNSQHPLLYFYEESDDVAFADAAFDPNEDTLLTSIEVSERDNEEEQEPEENMDLADEGDQAFEVTQRITQLFKYADFQYGDTVNMSVGMYNEDNDFSVAATGTTIAATDESEAAKYKFSKRGVRKLKAYSNSTTADSVRLNWKRFRSSGKNAKAYEIKIFNADNDKVVKFVKGVKKTRTTINGLEPDQSYRAIVRAVERGSKNNNKSSWSSGYKWTTDSE